jgi:hypothetical protein
LKYNVANLFPRHIANRGNGQSLHKDLTIGINRFFP